MQMCPICKIELAVKRREVNENTNEITTEKMCRNPQCAKYRTVVEKIVEKAEH